MTVKIAPFTVDSSCDCGATLFGHEKEKHIKRNQLLITYLGIYLDGKYISYTSSKELAEKTKVWIEKWLKNRL